MEGSILGISKSRIPHSHPQVEHLIGLLVYLLVNGPIAWNELGDARGCLGNGSMISYSDLTLQHVDVRLG